MSDSVKTVYIASYPRSGNTWIRILLEYSLGFTTRSIYDSDKRQMMSLATQNDRHILGPPLVDLVKTHQMSPAGIGDRIYAIRDGRDATASYWHFAREIEGRDVGTFSSFLRMLHAGGNWWANHVYEWLSPNNNARTLVVKYEDLHKDSEAELQRMLDFLGLHARRSYGKFKEEIDFGRLSAAAPNFFRRGQQGLWRELFSYEDEEFFLSHDLGMLKTYGYLESGMTK